MSEEKKENLGTLKSTEELEKLEKNTGTVHFGESEMTFQKNPEELDEPAWEDNQLEGDEDFEEYYESRKRRISGWVIATIVVIIVGIVGGLVAAHVQKSRLASETFERTVAVGSELTSAAAEEEDADEADDTDAEDDIDTGEDALLSDTDETDTDDSASDSANTTTTFSEDDAIGGIIGDDSGSSTSTTKSTKTTTKTSTTRRTTQWDAQGAVEDFWNGFSDWLE